MSDLPLEPHDEMPVIIVENDADYEAAQAILVKYAEAKANTAERLIFIAAQRAVLAYEDRRQEPSEALRYMSGNRR